MRRATALVLAAALGLAGCASIPTSGPVEEGNADISPVDPLVPIQEGPDPSDDPAAIVTGFLTASASGVATDFTVAREFLTPDAAASWDPGAHTLVYDSGAVTPEWNEATRTVNYGVPLSAAIDESGRRIDAADDAVAPIEFTLAQDAQGQWRISELDDGVVISEADFTRFFRAVDLVFATTDRTTVVPEVRWLPDNNIATAVSRELIEGPSPWLADAVVTGFPASASLAVQSVVVEDGLATVDLSTQSASDPEDSALALEQMRLSLTGLPSVTDVEVRIGGLPLAVSGDAELAAAPVPDGEAAAFVDGRLGVWDGEQLWTTPLTAGGVGDDASGLARAYPGGAVAYLQGGSEVVTTPLLGEEGTVLVEPTGDLGDPPGPVDTTLLHSGEDLVAPSFDRYGYVWTAETSGDEGLVAIASSGEETALPVEWLQTRSVIAIAVSRDGARIVVVSRAGGQPVVEVAALVRDPGGVPLSVGEPLAIGAGVGTGVEVVWVDDTTVGVLGQVVDGSPTPLWLVEVGGATTVVATIRDAVDVAVRSGETSLLVIAGDGHGEERSGSSWVPVLTGVSEIAYSG
ncbi:LpqB family beta-propeller domain-containing protein [Demequina sp. NBRC 110056]|uniref:LpqB family beta-propeller domain-containing protein n=1 Tax=Demequina sp. NBRC 110056 TaxID=1570345 RepID=UPI000A06E029|nr:LpqB family beta-propeller domain-containing protein [Demequina sp. NBRC 110056]